MTPGKRIYPIFLPHAGCPFQCVYCNQNRIVSGSPMQAGSRDLMDRCLRELAHVETACANDPEPMEVAFYGGTFTALSPTILHRILGAVKPLVAKGVLSGVRFSTRPDFITHEICEFLACYPVQTVELGVQSFDDEVLEKSRRGHDSRSVEGAAAMIRERGWTLGIQLMLGLPGDTAEKFLRSVQRASSLGADLIRFYPVLVLEGTDLARWFEAGLYTPLPLEEAVEWCVPAYDHLVKLGRPPIRMGLQADAQLEQSGTVLAGPYHPSFGYLVRVRWWRQRVDELLSRHDRRASCGKSLTVHVPQRVVSEVLGPGRVNLGHWGHAASSGSVTVKGHADFKDMDLRLEWN